MSGLDPLLDPKTIAIVGVSADPAKHGRRVLGHLLRLGYPGTVWGVNPRLAEVEGIEMFRSLSDLPQPPDLVVCAVPAGSVSEVVMEAAGSGAMVVFAGGFAESDIGGAAWQADLVERAGASRLRVLGPNSGGVIRPSRGLAASFLTCLDRPADQIRSGPVALVTQSGGTGSYIHNLAAAVGSGLAISVSTGNEADIRLGEAIAAVSQVEEVKVVLALVETVRDGPAFLDAVESSLDRGKPVVVCRIGTGRRAKKLMTSHTGAMALPDRVLEGVLDSLGVVMGETPAEAYEVAEMIARSPLPRGSRTAIVTHSGGIAIHLADLAERHRVDLPQPGPGLQDTLDQHLDHGAANNPLDMGGIIGGPGRFAEVVQAFAGFDEYDLVLAVSTPHPPTHTDERVISLLGIRSSIPILHLWMAGDQAESGLFVLRREGVVVTEEPRAAIRAVAALARVATRSRRRPPEPLSGTIEDWGLPLIEGELVTNPDQAVTAAHALGYPVVMKLVASGLAHKTEVGGVRLSLGDERAVRQAYLELAARGDRTGLTVRGVRVERFRPGLELNVAAFLDPTFGPLVSVGLGGILTELLGDVVFAPAPVGPDGAREMVDRLRGRALLDGFRGSPPADLAGLAGIVSLVSRGLVGGGLAEVEINPLIWDGTEWVVVDWLTLPVESPD